MDGLTVSEAGTHSGWSPRMLRYLERFGLVAPRRTSAGYRLYGLRELNQLRSLAELRERFDLQISDLVFAARLQREPELLLDGRKDRGVGTAIRVWICILGGIGFPVECQVKCSG